MNRTGPSLDRLVSLLMETQLLDRVPRTGFLLRGISDCESVAEHSFHVAFLVMLLGQQIAELDRERAVHLAILHDLGEVRLGDLPRFAQRYLPAGAKREAEAAVLNDLLDGIDDEIEAAAREALAGESREARFVKACDHLQLLVKVRCYERQGRLRPGEFFRSDPLAPLQEFAPLLELGSALQSMEH